jgi:hypothetical protein
MLSWVYAVLLWCHCTLMIEMIVDLAYVRRYIGGRTSVETHV